MTGKGPPCTLPSPYALEASLDERCTEQIIYPPHTIELSRKILETHLCDLV